MSDATVFYIVGGTLAVLAVLIAFVGMRSENFPTAGQMKAVIPLFAAVVAVSGTWAVLAAREEQAHKAEEAKHAAEEGGEKGAGDHGDAPSEQDDPSKDSVAGDGPGDASAGAAVFTDIGCGGCHTLADAGSEAAVGPNLDEELAGKDAEFIETSIVDPNAEIAAGFGPNIMPQNYGDELSADDLADLVAYLRDVAGK